MSGMVSISRGHSAEYLTGQVAEGRESYYLDATTAGEPPGRWSGAGAEALGLTGEVDNETMHELYGEFTDPNTGERLGRAPSTFRYDGQTAAQIFAQLSAAEPDALPERVEQLRRAAERHASHKAVMFYDLTFSPPKSFTVVHTAAQRQLLAAERAGDQGEADRWRRVVDACDEAIWAGNKAMLDTATERAGYARVGKHTSAGGQWIDARDWVVASFHQSDSRNHDPQQHVHNAVLNRVRGADGEWHALDGQQLYAQRGYAAAVGGRVLAETFTQRTGLQWALRPDGKGREIVGIDQEVMDAFSSRRANISTRLRELVDEYEQRHGREASAAEMTMLSRRATMQTRAAKEHAGETREQMLDRWERTLRERVGSSLREVAEFVDAQQPGTVAAGEFSPAGVVAEAVAACQETQSTFRPADLARQIELRLPSLGGAEPARVRHVVDTLVEAGMSELVQITGTDELAASAPVRLDNGRSAMVNPSAQRYASRGHLRSEQALQQAAVIRDRARVAAADVDRWLTESGSTLGKGQAAAVRGLMTSGARVSQLVGPAGTGKSFTVAQLRAAWRDLAGGQVIGLATAERAAQVLQADGVPAMNTARWLTQQANGSAGGPWALSAGHIVVVDEASMSDLQQLEQVRRLVEQAGARLVLTGDPRQLSAVGAGGAMDLVDGVGVDVWRLDEVRRFDADWEAAASLRLRDGDTDVVGEYDRHGRLRMEPNAAAARHAAARAYVADAIDGRSAVVVAATNDEAAQLSREIRDMLVRRGVVDDAAGVELGRDGNTASIGDVVMARENHRGLGVVNRGRYEVLRLDGAGGLVVRDGKDERHLSAAYVRENVQLAYAGTVHAAQGVTVDRGYVVLAQSMGLDHLYVGMTRGQQYNVAFASAVDERPDESTGETHLRGERTARQQVTELMETERATDRAALIQAAADAEASGNLATISARIGQAARHIAEQRLSTQLDELTAAGRLTAEQRYALAVDQGSPQLALLLRAVEQAGHDPARALADAMPQAADENGYRVGDLGSARSLARVLHSRVRAAYGDQLAPSPDSAPVPAGADEDWAGYLTRLTDAAEARRVELGEQAAAEAPDWATAQLGPVPAEAEARTEWVRRAGTLAGWAEQNGRAADEAESLGSAPGLSTPEKRADWFAAWTASGRPDVTRAEHELSVGQLRNRVQAWEREQQWAPAWVDAQQRATEQALADAQTSLTLDELTPADREAAELRVKDLQDAAQQLEQQAAARRAWERHTATTATMAERAEAELAVRGEPAVGDEPDRLTAEELLSEQARGIEAEDTWRPLHESDIADAWSVQAQAEAEATAGRQADEHQEQTARPVDEHDQDAAPDVERRPDAARVAAPDEPASADQLAEATARAEQVSLMVKVRDHVDAQRETEDQARRIEHQAAAEQQADRSAGMSM